MSDIQTPTDPPASDRSAEKAGWLSRLRSGLSRSSTKLTDGIAGIFTKRKLDDQALEELEELLIAADLGPATAAKLTAELSRTRFGKDVTPEEVRGALATHAASILAPVAQPLTLSDRPGPTVILVVGVNGVGKTTTIGKLAKQWRAAGKSVVLAAGDTFRAAAVSQLKVWGERAGCVVVTGSAGADPAGLAYDALDRAIADRADLLLIDTAGRLQNKAGLMAELQKIIRVLKRKDPEAPHAILLVLDATTGQNAYAQVEVFKDMAQITGLIVTKLDGSARGGVLVGLAERFGLPVHAVGVGEGIDDLRSFDADQFARALMHLDS